MEVKSKIKRMFDKEMRHYIAAICDTRQIQNNILKMDLLQRLLTTRHIQSEQLGGATNRYVVMIDGYGVKIAVDRQGFKDNLMEYALTKEVAHTTKSFETNGYILIQECVRILTLEEWRIRKIEILKILDELGRDYLLGDVGYDDLNRTNWGVTDDGELVILDYAYCHRLTEDLFTCPLCGSVLTYDQNFTQFLCTDRANCHARYSYNQIKARQGDDVDWKMIEEKKRSSLIIPKDKDSIEVERSCDILLDESTFVIRNYYDMARYKEVKNMLRLDYSDPEVMRLITSLTFAKARPVPDKGKIAEIESALDKLKKDVPEVRCTIDPEFENMLLERDGHLPRGWSEETQSTVPEKEPVKADPEAKFSSLMELARATRSQELVDEQEEQEWEEPIAPATDVATEEPVKEEPVHVDSFSSLLELARRTAPNEETESVYVEDPVYGSFPMTQEVPEEEVVEEPEAVAQVEEAAEETAEEVVEEEAVEEEVEEEPFEEIEEIEEAEEQEELDDVVGEPDSELEAAVEEDLPQVPQEQLITDQEFTTEPVHEFDGYEPEGGEIVPLEVTALEGEEDPEEVIIDGASLSDIGEEGEEDE